MLETAIKSVFEQDYHDVTQIQYLIVDDGTLDFDIEFVSRLVKKYDSLSGFEKSINVKIIKNSSNVGTVASFNNAIKKSTGDIIIPLSADDCFYDQKTISCIVNSFKKSGAKIITGQRAVFCSEMIIQQKILPSKRYARLFDDGKEIDLLNYVVRNGNIISGASTYYHREVFYEYGLFDTKYKLLEDYPFYCKLLADGCNISFLPYPTIKYRGGGVSSEGNQNPLLLRDFEMLNIHLLSEPNISKYSKRKLYYRVMLTEREKHHPLNIFIYFDLIALDLLLKILRHIRK
jgi:Glycosyltransferases, probably involved in cell wall biogenesis